MTIYTGTDGDDTLTGTAADDKFLPKLGDDMVDGEQGRDSLTVDYSTQATGSTASYIVDYGAGAFYGQVFSGANSTMFGGIEAMTFKAGQGADMLDVNAAPLASGGTLNLDGGGGDNMLRIDFQALTDTRFVVDADGHVSGNRGMFKNWGSYNIFVGGGGNTVTTGAGDDQITAYGGVDDRIATGDGNDMVAAYDATGIFDGGAGRDSWSGQYQSTTALTFNDALGKLSNGVVLKNFENINLGTGSGDDVFNLSAPIYESVDGGTGRNTLNADFSANTITSYSGIGPTSGGGSGFQGYLNNGSTASFYNMEVVNVKLGSGTDFVSVNAAPLASGATLTLDGGAGVDQLTIDFSALADRTTFIDNGDGTVTSDRGRFYNFESYDIALGGGHNTVTGGSGDDIIRSHGGIDTIDGGADDGNGSRDQWFGDYGAATQNLSFNDATGRLSNGTTLAGIETVGLSLGSGDDKVTLSTSTATTVDGGTGDDTLTLDYSGFVHGGLGLDIDAAAGRFQGDFEYGKTVHFSNFENLVVKTGTGDDSLHVNAAPLADGGTLNLDGGGGTNALDISFGGLTDPVSFLVAPSGEIASNHGKFANFQSFTLSGGAGNDHLVAPGVVSGGDGNDIIGGGPGNDTLDGGNGFDIVTYDNATAAVTVDLGSTATQDTGGAGMDLLLNFEAATGSAYNDHLTAAAGGGTLRGGAGDDVLTGGMGTDFLVGGAGADIMTGGGGADRFIFNALTDFAAGPTLDRITDFSSAQRDKINLSPIDPDAAMAGDQAFTFIGANAFTGASGSGYEIREQNNMDGSYTVFGDVNHDGVADFSFTVVSPTALVASDFIL